MKSNSLPTGFPTKPQQWQKLLAAAPELVADHDGAYDPNDPAAVQAFWKAAALVESGGLPAVLAEHAARRARGQRGPNKAPKKVPVTVRYSPEVLAAFKATGKGWQVRMDAALKDWLATHTPG